MKRKYPAYLDWIRGLPCSMPYCFKDSPSEPHHFKGEFNVAGMGLKSADYLAIPVCRQCHDKQHSKLGFWRPNQREALIRTLIQAFEQGMIQVNGYPDGIDDPLPTQPLETKETDND